MRDKFYAHDPKKGTSGSAEHSNLAGCRDPKSGTKRKALAGSGGESGDFRVLGPQTCETFLHLNHCICSTVFTGSLQHEDDEDDDDDGDDADNE